MARKPRWNESDEVGGIAEVKLLSWKYFSDYINQQMLDYTGYFYRGHGDSKWKLESTMDRIIKSPTSYLRGHILEKFKFETRGRRGPNPPQLDDENDWWALGQHHGLQTPLLDWTESPFVALYFGAVVAHRERSKNFAVFALHQGSVTERNERIKNDENIELINKRKPTVKVVRPLSDENSRLVNQRGLFTRGPNNVDIETWVKEFRLAGDSGWDLIKIIIPTTGVRDCLRYLNRMNINHSTLFPDLMGASEFCNQQLKIKGY